MKLNKIIIASIAAVLFLVSCDNWNDTETLSPTVDAGCPAVRFAATNPTSFEISPSNDMSLTLTVLRDSSAMASALEVPVTILRDSAFTIPKSVSFSAGSARTTLLIKINSSAIPGSTLTFAVKFDDPNINPYKKEYATYYGTVLVSPWVNMGKAQFYDDFVFAGMYVTEVTLEKNFLNPNSFRISFPYSEDILIATEWKDASSNWIGGATQTNIVFTLNGSNVTWSKFWYTHLLYQGTTGQEIKAYLPSAVPVSGGKAGDNKSVVVKDGSGNIEYFDLFPYYWIDGVGGFGLNEVLVGFPGFDLSGELDIPVF